MKKIAIAALAALTLGAVQAEYTIKQPLEQAQGGSLPNNSIIIKSLSADTPDIDSSWVAAEPLYYNWTQSSCDWTPTINGENGTNGAIIEQHYACSHYRQYKEREINTVTGEYRFIQMYRPNGMPTEFKTETKKEEGEQSRAFECLYASNYIGFFFDYDLSNASESYYLNGVRLSSAQITEGPFYRGAMIEITTTPDGVFPPNGTREGYAVCTLQ